MRLWLNVGARESFKELHKQGIQRLALNAYNNGISELIVHSGLAPSLILAVPCPPADYPLATATSRAASARRYLVRVDYQSHLLGHESEALCSLVQVPRDPFS